MKKPILLLFGFLLFVISMSKGQGEKLQQDPRLKTKVVVSSQAERSVTPIELPNAVLTTKSTPRPAPQVRSVAVPINSHEEQLKSYELKLSTLENSSSPSDKELAKKIERLIEQRKLERSIRERSID